jgi:hypothetical protein
MTRDQMHAELKFLLDKVDSSASPLFLPGEMDKLLNISQDKFVTKRAFGNNTRRTSFEEDQKRRDDLRTLIHSVNIQPTINSETQKVNKPMGQFFVLPSNYRHSINEEVLAKSLEDFGVDNPAELERSGVTPITHDRYNKIIDDPFNKPSGKTFYRLDYGDNGDVGFGLNAVNKLIVEVLSTPEYHISTYILRYIKDPIDISSKNNCILPPHTHREIVRMAVLEALESIESPRYQSSKIELNEIE